MSDAQWPPETGEGEGDPALPSGVPQGGAGGVAGARLEPLDGDPRKDQLTSLPDAEGERGSDEGVVQAAVPAPGEHEVTSEAACDDIQPMLDLRFPDAPTQVLLPSEPQPLILEPIELEFSADSPAPADPDGYDRQRPLDVGEAAAETEPPVEVSPILSALDAAERDAQAVQGETAPQPHPYATDILLPPFELVDRPDETVTATPELPASEPQGMESHEGSSPTDTTIEVVSVSEAPQDGGVAPQAEEQKPPAEALSDDAAARIAAEASATAAALENLRRLLVHKLPEPNVAPDPSQRDTWRERPEPPPIPAYRPAVQLPVSPPPMVAASATGTSLSFADYDDAPPRRRWVSVGSFFAGFALSWVLGAVLYVFLTGG